MDCRSRDRLFRRRETRPLFRVFHRQLVTGMAADRNRIRSDAAAGLSRSGREFFSAPFSSTWLLRVRVFTSLGIATGNTLEAVAAVYLTMRYANGRKLFEHAQDFFKFAALSMLAAAISATIGVTSLALGGLAHWHEFVRVWLTWWLGDVGGFLLFAPFPILWAENPRLTSDHRRLLESSVTLAAITLFGVLVFAGVLPEIEHYPIGFICIPILVWSAFRFGQREAATALFILAVCADWGMMRGHGPWARFASRDFVAHYPAGVHDDDGLDDDDAGGGRVGAQTRPRGCERGSQSSRGCKSRERSVSRDARTRVAQPDCRALQRSARAPTRRRATAAIGAAAGDHGAAEWAPGANGRRPARRRASYGGAQDHAQSPADESC